MRCLRNQSRVSHSSKAMKYRKILILCSSLYQCLVIAEPLVDAQSAFERADYIDAYQKFAAIKGDETGKVCYYLGLMNQQGWGKIADSTRAVELYECAVALGHVRAMHNLAGLYHRGDGVEQDLARARELYSRAAKQGGAKSAHRLGLIYFQGDGVERDFHKALQWWQQAFAGGEADAGYNLGILSRRGLGTPRDDEKALDYWRDAAERGSAHAQNAYATALMKGEGVMPDPVLAYAWFRAAANSGISVAQINAELVWQSLSPALQEQAFEQAEAIQQSFMK